MPASEALEAESASDEEWRVTPRREVGCQLQKWKQLRWRLEMAQYYTTHHNNNNLMKGELACHPYSLLPYSPYIPMEDEHCETETEYLQAVRFQQGAPGVTRREDRRPGK